MFANGVYFVGMVMAIGFGILTLSREEKLWALVFAIVAVFMGFVGGFEFGVSLII